MMLVGRIVIELAVDDDGELLHDVLAEDAEGDDLPLVQSLGMIEMAKDTLLRGPEEE